MLFQFVVLLVIASPVAASSTTGAVKPLKILTLGKQCQDIWLLRVQSFELTYLKTGEACKDWQRC